jgi:hypothetical protein
MKWIERRRELFRLADVEADTLIGRFGKAAYGEARRRAREARRALPCQDRPEGHWERVRIVISGRRKRSRVSAA